MPKKPRTAPDIGVPLYKRLAYARDQLGLTNKQICPVLGVSENSLGNFLRGKSSRIRLRHLEDFKIKWLDPSSHFQGKSIFFTALLNDETGLHNLLYQGERFHPLSAAERPLSYLIARPARVDDIGGILEIAKQARIASMTYNRDRRLEDIRISQETLNGDRDWGAGLLFLVTEGFKRGRASGEIIACSKISNGLGGYWTVVARQTTGGGHTARTEYLEFRTLPPDQQSLELGGNYVLEPFRGVSAQKTGRKSKEQAFPFYEKVVKYLLGGLSFEEADRLRFEHNTGKTAIPSLLTACPPSGEVAAAWPPRLPRGLVGEDVFEALGKVAKGSKGAEIIWKTRGFRHDPDVPKYDAINAGMILEARFADLERRFQQEWRELKARRAADDTLGGDGRFYNFARRRPKMSEFMCARAGACLRQDTLLIDQSAFERMELQPNERVWVLVPKAQQGDAWAIKAGSFSADARILFLMMYKDKIVEDVGAISFLFVDLLPEKQ